VPPVIGFLGLAFGVGTASAATVALSTFIVSTAASIAIGQVARLFRKKPGASGIAAQGGTAGRQVTSRQSAAARRVLFGKHSRLGGVITFLATSGANNQYIHLAITLTGHQVNSVKKMFFDGVEVTLDGSDGDLSRSGTGSWLNYVYMNANLGTRDQAAFSNLVSEGIGWTTAHRQRGCAGVYVKLLYGQNQFPNGLPNITFEVEGALCYDPRSGTTAYTANTALCVSEYLTNATWGAGFQTRGLITGGMIANSGMGGFSAAACVDDSVTVDCWNTDAASSGATVTVDHGSGVTPEYRRLRLYLDAAGCTANYTIERSDNGSTWSTAASGCIPDLIGWNEWYLNPNGGHRYWRLRLTNTPGAGADVREMQFWSSDVDSTILSTAANECDEDVTLKAGGTEDRYTCNGTFDTSETPSDVLPRLNSAMAGHCVYSAGKWGVYPGAWRSSSLTLTDSDLRSPLNVQTRSSQSDLFNGVKGIFVSPTNNWQLSDFPPYVSATYRAEDQNEPLWLDVEYPFTTSGATVQRISKILLERRRRQITFTGMFKLNAYQVQPMNVISFTHSRFGWSAKTFVVTACSLVYGDDGDVGVNLALQEEDSTAYDWTAATDEGTLNTVPTPDLPTTACTPPSGLTLTATEVVRAVDGVRTVGIRVDWTAPADIYVTSGGHIVVQYKRNADSDWITNSRVSGDLERDNIYPVADGTQYNVRIWAENIYGVKSSTLSDNITPTASGVTLELISDGGGYVKGTQHTGSAIVVDNANFEASSTAVDINITNIPGWSYLGADSIVDIIVSYNTTTQQSGTRSIRIQNTLANSGLVSKRTYKCVPGEIYKVSGYAKVAAGSTARIWVQYFDGSGTPVGSAEIETTSTSWTPISKVLTVPTGSVAFWIRLTPSNASGDVHFDNIGCTRLTDAVDEIAGKTTELVRNPNVESGDRDWSKGTGWTIEASNPYDGTYAGKYTGAADAALTNDVYIPIQPGQKLYTCCMIKKASGTATPCVAIEWYDSSKSSLSSSLGSTVTASTFTASEVIATAPASAFFARVKVQSRATVSAVIYVDQFDVTRLSAQVAIAGSATLKTGTGAGDYTNATGSPAAIDTTNLSLTTTVPVGWKLIIHGNAVMTHSVSGNGVGLAVYEDSTERDNKLSSIVTAGQWEALAVEYMHDGDGSSHTWRLYSTGAATVTISNSSAGSAPKMTFLMVQNA